MDVPTQTGRPEVTPPMLRIEHRCSLMYETGLSEVTVVVAVHHTAQPRLCVEVARARVGVLHLHGTCQLIILRIEHVVALSPEIVAVQTIVLVSGHGLHVVLVELLVPVQTLLVVVAPCTSVVDNDNTVPY